MRSEKMNKTIKKLISSVSIVLCATIGLSLPLEVFASTLPKDEKVYSSFDNVHGETETVGNIVTEISDSRTENTKEFLLDDGTTMIAEYNQPVHYKNDKGKWVEYNNTLVAESSTSTADEASDGEYTNKSSNIDVKLSNKAKSNNMIKVTSDDYSISWGYDGANKSKINIVKNDEKLTGNDKFTTLKNITTEAKYENVYKNVDLQYFVTSTGVKENIILKSSDVQNEFNLTYKIKNLTAKQTDDYTITLYNKNNKEVYKIVAPYMTDAKGESSNQLKLELVSQKGGNLQVGLTADYWFIHSIGRSYPITIDPEVTNKLTSALTFAENTNNSIKSYGPYYNSNNSYLICVVNSLPQLEDGEKIVSAKYNFEITNGSSQLTDESDNPIIINAHKLKSAANGVSEYDSDILDYDSLTYNDNQYVSFDLTKTVNEWYDNGDSIDGFVLESFDTIGSKSIVFQSPIKTSTTPSLTFIYKDFKGTESNLSYHTIEVGHHAQASVSDYLGNLVINQSLYEGTGSRMPVTLTATYNSINYNTAFANGSPSGYGWQFSFNQYVRDASTALANKGYNYIYTDSDGTDHYLKKSYDNEEWYDEDGLGITLTKTDTNILIDNGSTTQTYELTSAGGKLLSEKDEYDNTITYTYTDGNVTKITDGSGRNITISYLRNSEGEKRVKTIKLPDNSTIDFSYTSTLKDKINAITFSDGKQTKFEYDSSGRLLSVIQSDIYSTPTQQNKYTFTNSNGKVSKITEYGSDNTEGNYLNITYGNDNTTEFSDRQGRKVTYTFDNSGNQVSKLNANGYLESGDSNGLSISSGADSFTKNYITESTKQNAVGSGKYYYKTNGARNGVTSSGGTVTIDDSDPTEENGQVQYFGTTSIKVTNPVSSTNSAFFTGATHQIDSTEFNGKDITFSAYVKTKDVTEIYSGGPVGATLKIKCYDSSGATLKDVNSIGISGTQEWQRLSISVKVPDNTSRIRLYCNLRYTSGTAWFDCLQLEEGNCANDFNALQNGNFENNDNWLTNENSAISAQNGTVTLNGTAAFYDNAEITDETTSPDEEGIQPATYYETVEETVPNDSVTTYDSYGNVLRTEQGFVKRTVKNTYEVKSTEPTTGDSNTDPADDSDSSDASDEDSNEPDTSLGNKYIYQNVKVGRAGVVFNIVGEAQAKSVPLSNENRTFGIALNIYYEGNNTPETHYQEFNATTSHRQTVCMSVTPEKTNEEINYVAFAFVYSNNANSMTAYNAMLNIASAYASDNNDDNTETETDDNLIDYEVISENVDTTQEYMATSSTYDDTNNYAISETDEAGNTVSYTYDTNGNKTSVTDGEENVVNYTYNSNNDITSASSGEAENQYSYNSTNNISAITHNGFSYTFNYDVWGNLISTKIGDVALVSNTYSSNNGNLTKTTYANGDYIQYTYDKYGNITKLTSETEVIAEFVYNKKGLVAKAVDNSSETTTYYYYDFSGTLTGEYRQTDGGDLSYFLSYDSDGNKVEKTSINGQTKTITTGTDEDGKSYVSNDGVTAKTITDDFDRKTEVKTSRGEGNSVYFTQYEYADGKAENSTTNLVSKLTQKYGNNELVNYEYFYDGNGNIYRIKQNGTEIARYTYDELNQLIWSADRNTGLYTQFNYDNAGNITSVKEYNLSTTSWAPNGLIAEKTYGYGDSDWKDKLTSYNGTTISYDESGNPTAYRDGMTMSWERGRQLSSLQIANNSVSYKYDSNGMRTRKTDNSGTTYYYYDSDKNLIGLTKGNNTLLFYYDSDGNVTSFKHNGTIYYYIKNLQGDIVKIIDQAGTVIANYAYDVSGKILSIKDGTNNIVNSTNVTHLANLNPFRYRGYVYDNETGLYYLQSRYYDPITGRFLNADALFDTQSGTPLSTNMFAYCENDPINYIDPYGYASYKNSYTYNKSSKTYNITTKINIMWTNLTYKYTIKNGVVKFSFEKNTYWSVLWRGGGKLLAEAIYKVAKSINKNYLKGRSIGGINTEIQLHYIAFKLGIKKSSSKAADIGASYGNTGYDSNAWFFEGTNAVKIIAKFKINKIWAMASLIRDIVRYF